MRRYITLMLILLTSFAIAEYVTGYHGDIYLPANTNDMQIPFKTEGKALYRYEPECEDYLPFPIRGIDLSSASPAYNEEVTIEATIRSLLALDYKTYEIIVVDDGSRDNTANTVIEALDMVPYHPFLSNRIHCQPAYKIYKSTKTKVPVILVSKKNGGKADSLNMGINMSRYPYFLCMDADSILQRNSLRKIIEPVLEDDTTAAVGGCIRPCSGVTFEHGEIKEYGMPGSLIAAMQVLEYDRSFLTSRILFDKFNGSLIISGAFGLFKKDIVIQAGGYDSTTVGEDMELVVKIHDYCSINHIPYRIRYATDAVCWTQVPESFKDLCKQRRRWHQGLFESMKKYSRIMFNHNMGMISFISYWYFLLYELWSPYIEVFGVLIMMLSAWSGYMNWGYMTIFILFYAIFNAVVSLTAFFARIYAADLKTTRKDMFKAISLSLVETMVLRFGLAWVRAAALSPNYAVKRTWGEIQRKKISAS